MHSSELFIGLYRAGKILEFKLYGTWRFRLTQLDQWIASQIGQVTEFADNEIAE
jgi:hypothetical protein